jgi:hypothetical protein
MLPQTQWRQVVHHFSNPFQFVFIGDIDFDAGERHDIEPFLLTVIMFVKTF